MTVRPADQQRFGRTLRRWPEGEQQAQSVLDARLPPFEVWRSRHFLVQLFNEDGVTRITVNRTHKPNGRDWAEGVSWDDLMQVKREIGRADLWAVELYPPDQHIVNLANMRHLWLLDEPPAFGWRRSKGDPE